MKIINIQFIVIILSLVPFLGIGTTFEIENFTIGPNPMKRTDNAFVNYTATVDHTAEYFVLTATGQRVYPPDKLKLNIPSGDFKGLVVPMSQLSGAPSQLYIVIAKFTNSKNPKDIITKRRYVIFR